ncbi:MAG: metallophosphoesterase family protein [Thermodesulfobacteriota bacterium]
MIPQALFKKVERVLEKEPRLIPLRPEGKVVFVGDTHGDLEATREVAQRYLKETYRVVFLGDYVDRGSQSEENIHFLLQLKLKHPEDVFLLAGNHEGYMVKEFYPVSFWRSLSQKEREAYGTLFSKFPLAATSSNGILALHGALPDLETLEDFKGIAWGDENWNRIVWGDFLEMDIEETEDWGGRPQYGRPYFERLMQQYRKQVLIRSHQPHAPPLMFQNRCITIFTSNAYLPIRTIAIADMEKEIRSAEDLQLERI